MTDEEKKVKYKNIVYRLRVINNKIEELDNSISILKGTTKKSISIDNKGLKEEEMENMNILLKSVSSNIKGTIIPSLKNKIYN